MVFLPVLGSEWRKIRYSSVWIPLLISPVLSLTTIGFIRRTPHQQITWHDAYGVTAAFYGLLLFPLLIGILTSLVCRFEHLAGGWKQILALPVRRTYIYSAKFTIIMFFLALSQILMFFSVLFSGSVLLHINGPVPWSLMLKSLVGGWVAAIPLAALQLWVSTWWKSFGAQFAVNVIFTIPSLMIINSSTYSPYYPWVQPALAMLPSDSGSGWNLTHTAVWTVILSSVVFTLVGLIHFSRRDVRA
ncbi:ABC transporter permease [Alicyclobacillus sp. SO9]|uniref:ABC transporter permease n=1 Tax=Alicyclobacillus sp. SO9 TaxID=2665646 RepID=UPI0018E8B8EE|nr:ABC transporter permease [Alicyclobacillus sp. SO9]